MIFQKLLKSRLDELMNEAEIAVREGSTKLILSDKSINENKAIIPMILAVGAINSHLIKKV